MTVYPKGTTINDRYVLNHKLGSDGDVYEAFDRNLKTVVALKLLHPVGGTAQSWDEAQRLKALESSCLVPVLNADVVTNSDLRYIVTPIMDGGDLEDLARDVGLSVRTAINYTTHIAAGVSRIHSAGMIHRDIKPANVLLQTGSVVVSDLEFCEILDANGEASRTGSFCTLAPEAAPDDGRCSRLTDVYSVAATAFYLLSGQYPVDHHLPKSEQRDRIQAGQLRDLTDIAPHVPQSVRAVIRKGLAVVPADRHQTVDLLASALTNAMKGRRDWTRVAHAAPHAYCVRGERFKSRSGVVMCSISSSGGYRVQARIDSATARQVPGEPDQSIADTALARTVRDCVKRLSA